MSGRAYSRGPATSGRAYSIRFRLTAWYALVLIVILLLLSSLVFFFVRGG